MAATGWLWDPVPVVRRLATLLLVAALVAVPTSVRAVELPWSLTVEPGTGPPGSQVTALAVGFERCLADQPVETVPGEEAPPAAFRGPGVVELYFDREPLTNAALMDGAARVDLVIPPLAAVGEHQIQAVCSTNPEIVALTGFVVTEPPVELTVVPDLRGLSDPEARAALDEAGLGLGTVFGDGDRIRRQDPGAGFEVPLGSLVDVNFGAVPPPPDPDLVRVPQLVGASVEEARGVLTGLGLLLGGSEGAGVDGDSLVEAQEPAAGVRVPVGSVVVVTPVPAEVASSVGGAAWWALAALLGVLLAVSLLGLRGSRARKSERWVREHVRVEAGDVPRPVSVPVAPAEGVPPGHTVRIEPHVDTGTHVLEEVDR